MMSKRTKTLQFDARFLFLVICLMLGIGLAIYFLNRYDQGQKLIGIKAHFERLDHSRTCSEIKEILLNVDSIDAPIMEKLEKLMPYYPNGNHRFRCSEIIIETMDGYLQIPCYYNVSSPYTIPKVETVAEYKIKIFQALKANKSDRANIVTENLSEYSGNVIYYPLHLSDDRNIFIGMSYNPKS